MPSQISGSRSNGLNELGDDEPSLAVGLRTPAKSVTNGSVNSLHAADNASQRATSKENLLSNGNAGATVTFEDNVADAAPAEGASASSRPMSRASLAPSGGAGSDKDDSGENFGSSESLLLEAEDLRDQIDAAITRSRPVSGKREAQKLIPESYKSNSYKEELALAFVENFRRQFVQLYPDRKPLLLCPPNENGIEKFVCTTLRPTLLPYKELYDYDGCASFVADYLVYEPLANPTELPDKIVSPTSTLERHVGNCFDFSLVLCSLLLGAGYDAYCVCGYAAREITLMDQSRVICPLLVTSAPPPVEHVKEADCSYQVKPPRELKSRFIQKYDAKQKLLAEAAEKKRKEDEEAAKAERNKPKADVLHGLRVHSWVLVLAGKREVPEAFFIEPSTGKIYPTNHNQYLGIECVWTSSNYWVNMQDCSEGVGNMAYELGDTSRWEYIFPENTKPLTNVPKATEDDDAPTSPPLSPEPEDDENDAILDLPPSWVSRILVNANEYQSRCPGGKKTLLYKGAKLEKFAEYVREDGLVARLTIYKEDSNNEVGEIRETYANRKDRLIERSRIVPKGLITETFAPGRVHCLRQHIYYEHGKGDGSMTMHFYSNARLDGLVTRHDTGRKLTETFVNTDDNLTYRSATFDLPTLISGAGPAKHRAGPANPVNEDRPVRKMTEKFALRSEAPAGDQVHKRTFFVGEDNIRLTFHLEADRIIASTRDYVKPQGEKATGLEDITQFHALKPSKPPKRIQLWEELQDLLHAETACMSLIRESEKQVRDILALRKKEEASVQLTVSFYDTARNKSIRSHRAEIETKKTEEDSTAADLDYLAPFLARLDRPNKLTTEDAQRVREECLKDLKQRLIDKANLIQSRFEEETAELQRRQAWYAQNQNTIDKDEEEEYVAFCNDAMFRVHILEQRLATHKESAPQKIHQTRRAPQGRPATCPPLVNLRDCA
eukprot:Opistho-2@24921